MVNCPYLFLCGELILLLYPKRHQQPFVVGRPYALRSQKLIFRRFLNPLVTDNGTLRPENDSFLRFYAVALVEDKVDAVTLIRFGRPSQFARFFQRIVRRIGKAGVRQGVGTNLPVRIYIDGPD